jgi:ketosteroid isomerase-like protein
MRRAQADRETVGMTPGDRIRAYFAACNGGDPDAVAAHFTPDAVIYDTNVRPARGRSEIGAMWAAVSRRWGGARWSVDSVVESADGSSAAIEWSMAGTDPSTGDPFVFRGSEHYRFVGTSIDEIRQYWTFDRDRLQTGLVDYPYE